MMRFPFPLVLLLIVACSHPLQDFVVQRASHHEPLPGAALNATPSGVVRAGVARADITMPPGVSMFGHALDSRIAEGYWTRLYCRIFYFELTGGKRLVLVPCELPATSALLGRQVLANLVSAWGEEALEASELMITAVHTHAGFGHFFGAAQYTGAFSSRLPGYDEELLRELATRISSAIQQARSNSRPALLKWNHSENFCGFTYNRSLDAFRMNSPLISSSCVQADAELRAVDPSLSVLSLYELDRDRSAVLGPMGSLSFFAMHPTVIGSRNSLFGGDVAGVVSRHVERRMRQQQGEWSAGATIADPLHGVVNTNEGDISPIWTRGDVEEAIELGSRVGQHIWEEHPCEDKAGCLVDSVSSRIDVAYLEDKPSGARFTFPDGTGGEVCSTAYLGRGAAAGADDHRTSIAALAAFGSAPPVRYDPDECQSPKTPLLGCFDDALSTYPEVAPLAVARIDDTLLSFVPAELTVTAGRRVNVEVLRRIRAIDPRDAPTRAILVGLSNEYFQYVATPEEYQLQRYEGASTIYGSNMAPYFAHRMGSLAASLFSPAAADDLEKITGAKLGDMVPIEFTFGTRVNRMNAGLSPNTGNAEVHTCSLSAADSKAAPTICMYWRDEPPSPSRPGSAPWVRLVHDAEDRRPARICALELEECQPRDFVDDRGVEFRTRVHERVGDGWIWSTTFHPSAILWEKLVTGYRLQAAPYESSVFSNARVPQPCSPKQARVCHEGSRVEDWAGLVSQ